MIFNFNHLHFFRSPSTASRVLVLIGVALLLLDLVSCNSKTQPTPGPAGDRLKVLATTTIVGDVVKQVGGEEIDLDVLLPAGVDEHSFQYTPADVARAAQADLIFLNGAGLEEFMQPLLGNAGSQAELIEVSAGIPLLQPLASEHLQEAGSEQHSGAQPAGDPHVWTDPENVKSWVEQIQAALARGDPENAAFYQANAQRYINELDSLDAWIRGQVEQIPPENRRLVSDHQVFTYFAQRYGFEQVGALIPSYSTAAEPSALELAALEDAIRDLGVKAIFLGTTASPRMAERVAADTGVRLVLIYTGSLTESGGAADNYLDYMRYNVQAIVSALQ